jgi:hypothetical protein
MRFSKDLHRRCGQKHYHQAKRDPATSKASSREPLKHFIQEAIVPGIKKALMDIWGERAVQFRRQRKLLGFYRAAEVSHGKRYFSSCSRVSNSSS